MTPAHRIACLLAALSLAPLAADAKLAASGTSSVAFSAAGPAGLKIAGTTADFGVSEDSGNVTITVPLKNLTTGIGLRDKHMREKYLEVGKYPDAVLTVSRASLKVPGAGDATGNVKLHGKAKDLPFHYDTRRDGQVIKVTGSLRLNMKDFGIEVPTYMGVTVKPDVDVTVSFGAQE